MKKTIVIEVPRLGGVTVEVNGVKDKSCNA